MFFLLCHAMFNPFKNYVTPENLPSDADIRDIPKVSLWKFIWFFLRQIKWPLFAMGLAQAVSSIFEALGPYYVKVMIDTFQLNDNPANIWIEFGGNLVWFIILFLIKLCGLTDKKVFSTFIFTPHICENHLDE